MIPYDDLVAALSSWRARQGLPVSLGASQGPTPLTGSGPPPAPGSGPHAPPGSGPHGTPGSGPNRGAPPPPPESAYGGALPDEEALDVDDASMLEEQYENEGGDFAMAFGAEAAAPAMAETGDPDDATAIGSVPDVPSDPSDSVADEPGADDPAADIEREEW